MARRGDFTHREKKKTKKEARKIAPVTLITTPADVEVIGKKKRKEGKEPEEE
jgi:hypothetical protein